MGCCRDGIRRFCRRRALAVRAEYASNYYLDEAGAFSLPIRALVRLIHVLSLGRLARDHNNLTYVIEKPREAPPQPGRRTPKRQAARSHSASVAGGTGS